MDPKKMRNTMVDVDTIMDLLEEKRELYLTIPSRDEQAVKKQLSQAKFNRKIDDRLRMKSGVCYKYYPTRKTGSGENITPVDAVDLHITLGKGTDIFVLNCRPVDDTL